MQTVQSRKGVEDDYDEEEENEKIHTGDLIFFCKKTSDSIASESKKRARRERIGSETYYYDVPITVDENKRNRNANDVEDAIAYPVAVYAFVQFQSSFVEKSLKPFLIAWMISDEAQYELTGDMTNDMIVSYVYLRKHFKKELCKEVRNASDIEDRPPATYGRLKENRCSYVWGLPMSKNTYGIASNDVENNETNDLPDERRPKTSNEIESHCFLGPEPEDGCRKLLGFDPSLYEASSFELKTRKVYHHLKQPNQSKKTSKRQFNSLPASAATVESINTKTCSTSATHTTTAATTTYTATTTTTATTSVDLSATYQKTQNVRTNRTPRERGGGGGGGGNSKRSFKPGSSRGKMSLSFETVLKRMHIYHAIICDFMLDRAYESNYKERCKKMYEASQNWLPSWCFCCCFCDFGSSNDYGNDDDDDDDEKKIAVYYDPIVNSKEAENEEEMENEYGAEYKKIYNSKVHAPWMTGETIDSIFKSKSVHSILAYFDALFVCSSLMTVYSDVDPRTVCWSVSEKIKRCESMPKYSERASESKGTSLVMLSSETVADEQFQSKKEGSLNAGSRETTPRSDSDDKRTNAREMHPSSSSSINSTSKNSLTIVPNESDLKIEMTETLPFTCMTSGRRVKTSDVANNLRTTVTIYHQNGTRSGIRNTKDMVYFSKATSRELGTEFLISELKDCTF